MSKKPTLFIGSSTEGLRLAQHLQVLLEYECYSRIWTQGIFEPSGTTIHSLINALNEFDFAVFVFSPDDITKLRNNEVITARDNVIFEFGMCIGRLGLERTYFLMPRDRNDFHLPTDLAGVTPLTYDPLNENLPSALGSAATQIGDRIKAIGKITSYEERAHKNIVWLLSSVLEHTLLNGIDYDRILSIFMHTFHGNLNALGVFQVTAATLFELSEDRTKLKQIGSMGDASRKRVFELTDDSKYVVKCFKTQEMVMGFSDDLSPIEDYEYIICTPILQEKGIINTIHLRSEVRLDRSQHQNILDTLYDKNKVHFKILQTVFERRNEYAQSNQI